MDTTRNLVLLCIQKNYEVRCKWLNIICRITGKKGGNLESVDFVTVFERKRGRDSSVGIANRYGLDGPVIESRWGRDFPHPSKPTLGPIQLPIQWVPGLSRG
jgi:hypothetical protein